jgi:hypothetical protein
VGVEGQVKLRGWGGDVVAGSMVGGFDWLSSLVL